MTDGPLNILLTDPHLNGGGQVRYLTNLARELVAQGHDVTLGCRPGSVLVERAREVGCRVHDRFPFGGGLRLGAWVSDLRQVRQFIREEKPHIIHVNLSQDHWACGVANRIMGFPVCLIRTRHNTYPVRDTFANKILNLKWTDYQIVVCDVVCRTLAQQPVFDSERLCAIHNGIDAEQFRPDVENRCKARAEFGYSGTDAVLGIAARLVLAKGHEYLFKAAAKLKNDWPALRVLVLGQGELEGRLKTLAQELGIAEFVNFAGFRNDMPYCTQAFDIGVQPSVDCDTSSLSLKEQMAVEKPVVASDYGGLGEIVDDGVEGRVVPTGEVEPLAGALEDLLAHPDRQRAMGKAGRRRVLRDFTVQVFSKKTVEAYRHALVLHRERFPARETAS